jgi:hypothetical protein
MFEFKWLKFIYVILSVTTAYDTIMIEVERQSSSHITSAFLRDETQRVVVGKHKHKCID